MDRATQEPGSASISEEQATRGSTVLCVVLRNVADSEGRPGPCQLCLLPLWTHMCLRWDPALRPQQGLGSSRRTAVPLRAGSPPCESEQASRLPTGFCPEGVLSGVKETKT